MLVLDGVCLLLYIAIVVVFLLHFVFFTDIFSIILYSFKLRRSTVSLMLLALCYPSVADLTFLDC